MEAGFLKILIPLQMTSLNPRLHASSSSFWLPAMQVEPRELACCEVSFKTLCYLIMPLTSVAYTVVL